MSKTMIRVNKSKNYVVLSKRGLEDTRLVWKAKGLLAYLLSLPDDWRIYQEELAKHSKDGVKSTASALKELIKNGYVHRESIRDEKGRFIGYIYQVFEEPVNLDEVNIFTDKPKTENGKTDIRETDTTNYTNKPNNNLNIEKEKTNKVVELDNDVIKNYRHCISNKVSNKEFEVLSDFQMEVGKDILNKAITLASMKNAKNLSYVKAELEDWNEKGLKTVEEVELYLASWVTKNRKAKENKTNQINRRSENKDYKVSTFNNFEQRTYNFDELEKKLLGWE